jgi:hypothetical protein
MPNSDDLLKGKSDRLETVPSKLVESVSKLEPKIMREVEDLVSQLEMENGELILSEKNMVLIENINQRITNIIFDEAYTKELGEFIGQFKTQAGLNDQYFQTILDDYEIKPMYESVLKSSQKNAINLLNEDAFTAKLIQPIQQTLESSITNNVSFTDTLKNLRYIIQGDEENLGALTSHVKRVAYDSFAVSDRSYTNVIATDLGLEFFRYSGGEIETTRCFCDERAGKFYHRKEIEGWGEGKNVGACGFPWQGMNTNTDKATIFYYAGGYNCKHSILPVSKRSVPKEVIERAKREGYLKVA